MNKTIKKTLTWLLAVSMLLTSCMAPVAACAQDEEQTTLESLLNKTLTVDDGARTIDKAETVYVIAGADGTANQVIVSEWLKNPENADTLADTTTLQDIENTNGYETYVRSDNELTWNAAGSDIHYQGTTSRDLPVAVKITYYLNGVETAPEDMAGQSGHVTIRFDYENQTRETVAVDGEDAEISVPFLMVSALALNNDAFSNVTVTNGTVYNDGSRSIVLGYALPGLANSLALEDEDCKIPETVEIEADTTNFALSATLTVACNGLLRSLTFDADGLAEWNADLTDLDDAAQLIVDGTGELSTGAQELADGLDALSANSTALNDGASSVFSALTAAAQQQVNIALVAAGYDTTVSITPSNYSEALTELLKTVEAAAQAQADAAAQAQVRAAVTEQVESQVTQQVTETVNAQVLQQVTAQVTASLTGKGYTQEQAEAYLQTDDGQALLTTNTEQQTASQEVQQTIEAYTQQQMDTDEVQAAIDAYVAQQMATDDVQTQISTAVTEGLAQSDAYQSILALQEQLDEFATFYNGLTAYTAGVDSACEGAQTLASGAGTLADKVQEFYTEGVETLVSALHVDAGDMLDRLQAIAEADRAYQSFGGIAAGETGSVKFIWRTDGI